MSGDTYYAPLRATSKKGVVWRPNRGAPKSITELTRN